MGVFGIFRPGDRVRRGKKGPLMEVKGYDNDSQVVCTWYEAREGWRRQTFAERTLARVRRSRAPTPAPVR